MGEGLLGQQSLFGVLLRVDTLSQLLHENIFLIEQIIHEVFGSLGAFGILHSFNELGKSVGCEVPVVLLVQLMALNQETVEDSY